MRLLYSTYMSKCGGTQISCGHFCFACQMVSPVLTPHAFAAVFFAKMMPCRFSGSPDTATYLSFNPGLSAHSTDA